MSVDLKDLKKKALAATPGPWESTMHGNVLSNTECLYPTRPALRCGSAWIPDADYIAAANPANMLELIGMIELAEHRASHAQRLAKTILEAKNEWADRAVKAEERLAYLQTAYNVETLIRKDAIIARQEAENDRLKSLLAEQLLPSAAHAGASSTDVVAKIQPKKRMTDAELDELLEQIEAACKPPASEPKQKTLLDWIRDRMVGGGR